MRPTEITINSHCSLFSQVTFPTLAGGQRCTRIISIKIPFATTNRGFAVHRRMTDIRQVTAYTAPRTRASPTRQDKYPRLAIYLNSRGAHLSSSDICRLLAPPRSLPILSSSLLHSIRRPLYLSHHHVALSPSLSLSLFRSFTFYLPFFLSSFSFSVPSLSVCRPRDGASPRQKRAVCHAPASAIAYDVDCQNLGEAPGEMVYR